MNKHIFLTKDNAKEVLEDVLLTMKLKEWNESRTRAFEDCTSYWSDRVGEVLTSEISDVDKLLKIASMFEK